MLLKMSLRNSRRGTISITCPTPSTNTAADPAGPPVHSLDEPVKEHEPPAVVTVRPFQYRGLAGGVGFRPASGVAQTGCAASTRQGAAGLLGVANLHGDSAGWLLVHLVGRHARTKRRSLRPNGLLVSFLRGGCFCRVHRLRISFCLQRIWQAPADAAARRASATNDRKLVGDHRQAGHGSDDLAVLSARRRLADRLYRQRFSALAGD